MKMVYDGPGPGLVPVVFWRPSSGKAWVTGYVSPATKPLGVQMMFHLRADRTEVRKINNEFVARIDVEDN